MPSIRYRHNYRGVVLNGKDTPSGKGISGNTIPALLEDGMYRFFPFGGFLTLEFVQSNNIQLVKLPDIDGFSTDEHGLSDMVYIPVRISVIAIARFGLFRSPDPAVFLSSYFYAK